MVATLVACAGPVMDPPAMRVVPRDSKNARLVAGEWVATAGPKIGARRCMQIEASDLMCPPGGVVWQGAIQDETHTLVVYVYESFATRFFFYLGHDGRLHGSQQDIPAGGRPVNTPWTLERVPR
jgi:hypothetical protein